MERPASETAGLFDDIQPQMPISHVEKRFSRAVLKKGSSKNAIIFPEIFLYAKDFRPVRGTTLLKGAVSEGWMLVASFDIYLHPKCSLARISHPQKTLSVFIMIREAE